MGFLSKLFGIKDVPDAAKKADEPEQSPPVKQEDLEKEKENVSPKTTVTDQADVPLGQDPAGADEETQKQMDEMLIKMYGNDSDGLKKSQESIHYKTGQQEADK